MNVRHLSLFLGVAAALGLVACGGKPMADPDTLFLDASSPESVRASLDGMIDALGHMESFRLTKVLQDFRERIVIAYSYADSDDPHYPHALWRELQRFDGASASRLAEELPNTPIQGPSVEESAERLRKASTERLKQLYAPFQAYAQAHEGALPPAAPVEGARFTGGAQGGRIFDPQVLFPEYLADPRILVSPAHPQAAGLVERLDEALSDDDMDFRMRTIEAVASECYFYLAVAVQGSEEGKVFVGGLNGEADAALPPLRLDGAGAAETPLLMERPGLQLDGTLPVLYANGAVKVLPLGVWPNTAEFETGLFANLPLPE